MAEKSFHFFARLPTELRWEIWRLCLPYRVWEVDFPTNHGLYEPNADGSYPCQVRSTAMQNGLPPVITRVCQESRNIAFESGRIPPEDFYDDLPDDVDWMCATIDDVPDRFWIDFKRGSALLNWLPHYEAIYESCSGSSLAVFAWQSRQVVGTPSIMGGWFSQDYDPEKERFDVLYQMPSCWVIMHVFIIHASSRETAQSGLFGLLGDAPVQILPLSDQEKINAIYKFADQLSSSDCLERLSQNHSTCNSKTILSTKRDRKGYCRQCIRLLCFVFVY